MGNSWYILCAMLGHWNQNRPDRFIPGECSPNLQQEVNLTADVWKVTCQYKVDCLSPTSALRKSARRYSETRPRSYVRACTYWQTQIWSKSLFCFLFTMFGFIRQIWRCLDDSNDIYDPIKCVRNFRQPPWILPQAPLVHAVCKDSSHLNGLILLVTKLWVTDTISHEARVPHFRPLTAQNLMFSACVIDE